MQLIPRSAPHIRHSDNNKTLMGDMILTLLPLYLIGVCFYGLRVLAAMLCSVLVCWLADLLRAAVFRLLRIGRLTGWAGDRLDGLLGWKAEATAGAPADAS